MANLVRWDPFTEFNRIDRTFSRMMRRAFSGWPRLPLDDEGTTFEWSPSADISETDKEYLIRAELPAVKKEDVKVTLDNGALTISGERRQEKEHKEENEIRVESFYGTFSRSFLLPEDADANNIRAESKDGVLRIHIPKTESKKSKPIQIEVK